MDCIFIDWVHFFNRMTLIVNKLTCGLNKIKQSSKKYSFD